MDLAGHAQNAACLGRLNQIAAANQGARDMMRRLVFGAIAAPVLFRPAWSQGQPPQGRTTEPPRQSDVPPSRVPQPTMEGRSAAATEGQQGDQMLAAMAMALASAQLGTRSAADEGVKLFAQLELEEQMAFAEARRLAGLSAPAPNMLTAQQQQSLGALRAQSGAAFDRMFVSVQTEGHQELLRLNRGTAERPPGREEAMLATVAIPAIRSHLTMLAGMQRALPAPS